MSKDRSDQTRRPLLDPAVVMAFRRVRITGALAEVCAEKGYRATSIGDVTARAKLSRKSVYDNFANKEAIFLELLSERLGVVFERIEDACAEVDGGGLEKIDAALAAVIDSIAADPLGARVWLVEASTAGERSIQMLREASARVTELLRRQIPPDPERPAVVDEMAIGGVESILRHLVIAGDAARAELVLPSLQEFLREPYR